MRWHHAALLLSSGISVVHGFSVLSRPASFSKRPIESLSLSALSSSSSSSPPPSDTFPQDRLGGGGGGGGGRQIYSLPALYDLAFGYRNYEEEVEFLIEQHQLLHGGKAPQRVLELAAGPARHCLTALQASYVAAATALDVSTEMKEYALNLAQEELKNCMDAFDYVTADMTNFLLDKNRTFDSAWILLGSLQHLTTNEQVISCFQCIHQVLEKDGTLIVELPHPREIFSLVECTRNGWEIPLEDEDGNTSGELKIVWGDDDDAFDPIRQVRQFTISMELTEDNSSNNKNKSLESVKEVVPMRHFTTQEMDALARICGFEVVALHGALARDVDVNDKVEAFRLVCVLQKK
jgi:SAM-dependent methyltransferase